MKLSNKGFTLAELLCVISILLLLASILFPVFSSAKRSAKLTQCASNMRQIATVFELYSSDFDTLFPFGKDCIDELRPDLYPGSMNIRNRLLLPTITQVYSKNLQIWKCPSTESVIVAERQFPQLVSRDGNALSDCGMTYEYRTDVGGVSSTMIEHPASVLLLSDAAGHFHGAGRGLTELDSEDTFKSLRLTYRYNILFADTHTKASSYSQLREGWSAN